MYQGALGCLDPQTGKVAYYPVPPEWNDDRVQPQLHRPAPRRRRQGLDEERPARSTSSAST